MGVHEWITLIGVVISTVLSVTPWMFAVHTKLAVIATQVETLCNQVDRISQAHEDRLSMCIDHQSRLDIHEVQINALTESVKEAS
jgi:hypothetical protein